MPKQGKRTDLEAIKIAILAHKSDLEIIESCGAKAARYEKQINFLRFTYGEQASDRQLQGIRVIVIWGPTGTGKTYSAINYIAGNVDYFILEAPARNTDKLWFNSYQSQTTLIMDDFSGEFCNLNYLKRLLDKYRLKIEIKGGFVWACWSTVVITSNKAPCDWYVSNLSNYIKPEDIAALKRRITEVRFQDQQGVYKIDNFEGSLAFQPNQDFVAYTAHAEA